MTSETGRFSEAVLDDEQPERKPSRARPDIAIGFGLGIVATSTINGYRADLPIWFGLIMIAIGVIYKRQHHD